MKRFIRLLAVVMLAFLLVLPVFGTETENGKVQPRWTQLSMLSCYMDVQTGLFSNAHFRSTASAKKPDSKLSMTVEIQKWNSGDYYNTGMAWSASADGAVQIDQSVKLSAGQYRTITAVAVYTAEGSYIETVVTYSNSIVI